VFLFCLELMKTQRDKMQAAFRAACATLLSSLTSSHFKDYARQDGSVLLSYCNTLLGASPSSACGDFPSAEESLFGFSLNIQGWTQSTRVWRFTQLCVACQSTNTLMCTSCMIKLATVSCVHCGTLWTHTHNLKVKIHPFIALSGKRSNQLL